METTNLLNIQDVPFAAPQAKVIARSIANYAAAGIDIAITELNGNTITVVIEQARLLNGFILNNKQLYDRAKEVFKDSGFKVKVKPSVFSLNVESVNVRWIEGKLQEFGISRNDLIKQLAIDKASLSKILSGTRELSKPVRATFFYYFLTYELNRDLRQGN